MSSRLPSLRKRLSRQFVLLALLPALAVPGATSALQVPSLIAQAESHNADLALAVRDQLRLQLDVRLRAAAHKMKGSCGTVGLLAAQAHLASVEVAAKDSDLATARQHVDTLPSVFAAGMAQLRSFRDGV